MTKVNEPIFGECGPDCVGQRSAVHINYGIRRIGARSSPMMHIEGVELTSEKFFRRQKVAIVE